MQLGIAAEDAQMPANQMRRWIRIGEPISKFYDGGMRSQPVPQNPRILISRLSHIGDCILTLPVANAIRDAYPDAWIAWAIESPGDKLIRECPAIDQVFRVPRSWLKKPLQALSLRKLLRQFKFDVVIDPQSLTKSAGIGWLSGAKTRVGLGKPLGRELSTMLNNIQVNVRSRHVVDRSLEMLQAIGVQNPVAKFGIKVPARAEAAAGEIIEKCSRGSEYVVINPGAGWKSRQWSNERFGQVASHIFKQHQLTPMVTWFGEQEESMADEIIRASGGDAVKAPATGLWELGGLIQNSRFYLGCDTGPTHLAAALKSPCITLFGTTEPDVSGPYEFDPSQPMHIRIQNYYQAGTSRERRKAENEAMMAISVEDVVQGIETMVKRTQDRLAA